MVKTRKKTSRQLLTSIASLMIVSSMAVSQLGYTGSITSYAIESTEIVDSATVYISEEVAKATALADVGIQESNVKYINIWLAYDNGLPECYKVEFQSEQVEYKYEIDLYSGEVLEKILRDYNDEDDRDDKDDKHDKIDDSELGYIGRETAKVIALEDVGIQESDVKYINIWLAYDNGLPECYKVEFQSEQVEYKYEIDLYSGEVLEKILRDYNDEDDRDDKDDKHDKIDDSELGYIGRETAKVIALEDVGIQESDIKYANVWIDYAQGQPNCYVVKFGRKYDHGTRYKYEIDLYSGEVLTASTENYGDMNSDGDISVSDVIILHKYLHGVKSLTKKEYEVADINADGLVNIFDFVHLKKEVISK